MPSPRAECELLRRGSRVNEPDRKLLHLSRPVRSSKDVQPSDSPQQPLACSLSHSSTLHLRHLSVLTMAGSGDETDTPAFKNVSVAPAASISNALFADLSSPLAALVLISRWSRKSSSSVSSQRRVVSSVRRGAALDTAHASSLEQSTTRLCTFRPSTCACSLQRRFIELQK